VTPTTKTKSNVFNIVPRYILKNIFLSERKYKETSPTQSPPKKCISMSKYQIEEYQ
jgi:hypothetical protein